MQTSFEVVQKYKALFDRLIAGSGRDWTHAQKTTRERLLARLEGDGFPGRKTEEWKYTNTAPLLREDYILAPEVSESKAREQLASVLNQLSTTSHTVVLVNGRYSAKLSQVPKAKGVQVLSLREIVSTEKYPELRAKFLQRTEKLESERGEAFTWLNGIFYEDGVFVDIADECTLDQPLAIVHLAVGDSTEWVSTYNRHMIAVGARSSVKLDLVYVGSAQCKNFSNSVISIDQDESSQVSLHQMQNEANSAYHFGRCYVRLEKLATFKGLLLNVGGRISRQEVMLDAVGEETSIRLDGMYLSKENQHHDIRTVIRHHKGDGQSHQLFKGIATDRARVVFNGKIQIDRLAQKVNSSQLTKTLLLSPSAEVDAKPELEIYADDVKATHGATVGQLDAEQMFYMLARGISHAQAEALLAHGFLGEVLDLHRRDNENDQVMREVVDSWVQNRGALLTSRMSGTSR